MLAHFSNISSKGVDRATACSIDMSARCTNRSWSIVDRRSFLISFSLLNDLSAEATVTCMVRNTLNATTKFGNNESRFLWRMKLRFSIAVLHAEGRLHYRLLELGRSTQPTTLLHNTLWILLNTPSLKSAPDFQILCWVHCLWCQRLHKTLFVLYEVGRPGALVVQRSLHREMFCAFYCASVQTL